MTNALVDLLAQRDWLLLDGATGTNLFEMGLMSGDAPELWNVDQPEKIRALHRSFVEAGSDVILTNSFGGSRYRLKLHHAEDRVFELNKRAAELAREVADEAGRKVIVAGSVGPTGEILEPVGSLSHADAVAAFEEQIAGLIAGGADVIWGETISSEEELRALAEAAAKQQAPLCATLSFDTAGRTMMGLTSRHYAEIAPGLAQRPIAIGANCGTGASDLLRTVLGITDASPDALVIAKANAGIPKYVDGHIHYDGTPELMADYACLARDAGARLIGGCCGTKPEHLRAMRAALEGHAAGARPSLDEIRAKLGDFSSASDGTEAGDEAGGEGRRRRRRG
ncbi:betaine--homocysteine S-methyltransferase [Limibaculum sp. M0105]|uniref:Betaine--homocysteine S-methyltransferase n=1 Tax=Thermohalobaculum xanthum TaxID=2753746 RepID=A0A8J7M3F6_9RHOB|nr:betaine--homocysteine S-methyltransferase [Thermohalobaculum xanthum]MBK0397570.1 betaine--homocysteine S-methyltransferase [Thermohalobaculum xanthum]